MGLMVGHVSLCRQGRGSVLDLFSHFVFVFHFVDCLLSLVQVHIMILVFDSVYSYLSLDLIMSYYDYFKLCT